MEQQAFTAFSYQFAVMPFLDFYEKEKQQPRVIIVVVCVFV